MVEPIQLQKKARGERPVYFEDPAVDKVLSITLALAGETAVLHDRLDTIERLLESGTAVTRTAIDSFLPDAAIRAERDAWRDSFLANVLRIVHQEREDLGERAGRRTDYSAAIELVEVG